MFRIFLKKPILFRPFWSTYLNPGLATRIAKCLEESGFNCLNKDNPETFTKVHLLVWPENVRKQ